MVDTASRAVKSSSAEVIRSGAEEWPLAGRTVLIVDNRVEYFLSHRLELAKSVQRLGADVHVTALTQGEHGQVSEAGLTFHPITRRRRTANPLHEVGLVLELRKLLRRLRPDLLHLVTLRSLLYGGTAARLSGAPPTLHAVTGLGYLFADDSLKVRVLRSVLLGLLRLATAQTRRRFLFQNPDDLELFAAARVCTREESSVVLGSGVDVQKFRPRESRADTPTVLFASRMLRHKGVAEVVKAADLVADRGVDARFVLAGDTDPDNPGAVSRQELKGWDRKPNVAWVGYKEDMVPLFRDAAIVCLPSRYREGVPKVLLEAAATGTPAITADRPGCREAVIHGETGLLVDPPTAGEIADAVCRLLQDPKTRRRMGERARELALDRFSLESVIESTVDVYRRLLTETGQPVTELG